MSDLEHVEKSDTPDAATFEDETAAAEPGLGPAQGAEREPELGVAQEPEAEKAAVSDDDWDILERIFNRKR